MPACITRWLLPPSPS